MRSFAGRDILSLKDFSRDEFFRVFQVADDLKPYARDRRNGDLLKDKTLLTAFYQPSTRTRLSTEAAMHRLGGHVLGFSDAKMTRAGDFYQESIKDTFRMLESYGDVIAIRAKSAQNPTIQHAAEEVKGRGIPEWLMLDANGASTRVASLPTREQINLPVEEQQIVELYSK